MAAELHLDEWTRFFSWRGVGLERLAEDATRAAQSGMTAWDVAIFDAIWFDDAYLYTEERLIEVAFGIYGIEQPQTAAEAIQRCLDRGWIQVLDIAFITQKAAELMARGTLMPKGLFGSPNDLDPEISRGLISFTPAGADLYKSLLSNGGLTDHWVSELTEDGLHRAYGVSLNDCELAMSDELRRGSGAISHLTEQIGPWCDRWWNPFESGYRITFSIEGTSSP